MGSGEDTSTNPTQDAQEEVFSAPDEGQAKIIAEQFVENVLRSPSTADFPFLDYTTLIDGSRYTVMSYVDSQNGFGAMIRSNWTVIMDYKGGNWANAGNWSIEDIIIDGESVFSGL